MMMMLIMITMDVWRSLPAWLHMNLATTIHLKPHRLWNQAGCWRQTISYHLKCDAAKEACRCIATSSTMSSLSCSIRNGPANPKVTLASGTAVPLHLEGLQRVFIIDSHAEVDVGQSKKWRMALIQRHVRDGSYPTSKKAKSKKQKAKGKQVKRHKVQ